LFIKKFFESSVPVMAAIIADGIFMKSHPSSQRVRDRINDLYVEV